MIQETYDFLIAAHQKSFVSVNNVEEPTEKVHDDVEERLDDDRPQLHEPGAAEALLPDQHDVEVEEGEEGAKDCESCEHRDESDVEEILEGRAGEHLERLFIDLRHKPDYIVMSDFVLEIQNNNKKKSKSKKIQIQGLVRFFEETLKTMTALGNTRRLEMKREGNHHMSIVYLRI